MLCVDRVKTNQIGQYTLKINLIISKLQKLSLSGEQNVAAGEQIKKVNFFIPIINLSASRRNHSRESRCIVESIIFPTPSYADII
jgi:hypothetical protein